MLDTAHVLTLSPNAKDYIAEQTRKDRNTQEIVEDIHRVSKRCSAKALSSERNRLGIY